MDIKEMRIKLNLSQEALAHILGVSYHTISRWERGLSKPSPMALKNIKAILVNDEKTTDRVSQR